MEPVQLTQISDPKRLKDTVNQLIDEVTTLQEDKIKLQSKTVVPTKDIQLVEPDEAFAGLSVVAVHPIPEQYIEPAGNLLIRANGTYNVNNYSEATVELPESDVRLQEKSVTPTKNTQSINADAGYTGLSTVIVTPIPDSYIVPDGTEYINVNGTYNIRDKEIVDVRVPGQEIHLQNKEVVPTKQRQSVVADSGYDGLNTVSVGAIPDEYIVPEGTLDIAENGLYNVKDKESVNVLVPGEVVSLQDKSVTPTKEAQNVTADSGYTGLGTVEVEAIPDEYIVPNGSLEVTENNKTYDVTDKASVVVNVPSAGGGLNPLQWKCDNMKSLYYEFYDAKADINVPLAGVDTSQVKDFRYFANKCGFTDSIDLDVSSAESMQYAFNSSSFKTIRLRNMNNANNTSNIFANCSVLETLVGVNMIKLISANAITFTGCPELTNLTITNIGISLTLSNGSNYGTKLTTESIINAIKELIDKTGISGVTYKLSMGAAHLEKISNVYVKLVDVTDEMLANDPNANNKKPCVVCESTDEGAMLITEYATSKNWQLA